MSAETQGSRRVERAIQWGALALGVALFCGALYYINFRLAAGIIRRLGPACRSRSSSAASGTWRGRGRGPTAFPRPRTVSFARLTRVRLAAEAFSYLTLRGIAGEPLKVVLLGDSVDARQATAAVALERMAYLIGTTVIVGVGSVLALVALPLTHTWFRVFRAFAIAAAVVIGFTTVVIAGRGTYFQAWLRGLDRVLGTSLAEGRVSRFIAAVERQMLDLVRGNPERLVALLAATAAAYLCMALEAWVILRAAGASITPTRRTRRRDVLPRRELRLRVHPGQPRRTRSIESGRRECRRRGGRRRRARPCPAAPRPVLGRSRARDLPAEHATGRLRNRAPPTPLRSSGQRRCCICPMTQQ